MKPFLYPGYCPHIYGPIQSRRLGNSLGINIGSSHKKYCSWNCVYCQCGIKNTDVAPEELPTLEKITDEFRNHVLQHPDIECVTIAGNTEPTLHPHLFSLIRELKKIRLASRARWKINILSNGSNLDDVNAVRACDSADETWVKLDCAVPELFQKLNMPYTKQDSPEAQITRIKKLKNPRIQTLLFSHRTKPGFANFVPENLYKLLEAYREIKPAEVHITTLDRTTPVADLIPVEPVKLEVFTQEIQKLGISAHFFPCSLN